MKIKIIFLFVLVLTWFTASSWAPVYAQDATDSMVSSFVDTNIVTLEQLTERRETAVTDTSLAENQKATALALFDRGIQAIHATEKMNSEATAIRARADRAPARIAELSLQLEQVDEKFAIAPEQFADLPVEEVSTLAERARRKLDLARDKFYRNRVAIRQLSIKPVATIGIDDASLNRQVSVETGQRQGLARGDPITLFEAREDVALALRYERRATI